MENKELIQEKHLTPGGVTYINDSIGFHQVENVSSKTEASTLHCYRPPFSSVATLDSNDQIFDQVLTYFSEYGKIVQK